MRNLFHYILVPIFVFSFSLKGYSQSSCESMGWVNFDGQNPAGPVTGGGNATPVQVTTFSQLKNEVESSDPKVIYVMNDVGNGYTGTTGDVLNVASDKTIIGYSQGITIRCSWQIKRASNIIVRNLICRGPGNSNSEQNWDCVNIEDASRVWFDHCTVMEGEDGNFDVVKGSDNVTVTWCKFTYVTGGAHNFSNLIGSSNDEPQSHGKLNVTYAYCWWDNVNSRCPRTRYGKIHVLNCYYNNVGSGAYAGKMSNIRVEGSFFEDNVSNPTGLISTDGEAGVFVIDCNRGNTMTDGYNTPFTPPYSYEVTPVHEVKSMVTDPSCGAGPTLDGPADCGCHAEPVVDCNGDENGTAYVDECGQCVEGNTGNTACVLDCNGDENGSATMDNCGFCTGGNTGKSPCSGAIQGEDFCEGIGVAESDNTGFIGEGYFNADNDNGTYGTWYISASGNQLATLDIRYANGSNENRPVTVRINEEDQGTINGSTTGGWTFWESESVDVNLDEGVNSITLTGTTSNGGPNIDLIALPDGVVAGSCDADCNGTIGGVARTDSCGICSGGDTGIEPNSLCPQDPFNQSIHQIPGRIEAEDYDLGGNGIAYYDTDDINEGDANYRAGDGVDVESTEDTDGGYNIGYTMSGEWLEYTVNVSHSGVYDLNLRIAKEGDGGIFHIEMDGEDITGPVEIPNTGGWQVWETITMEDVQLEAGEQVMRIAFDTDYTNLNYVEFHDVITGFHLTSASEEIKVYPNPFEKEGLRVKCAGAFKYRISSIDGIVVEKGNGVNSAVIGAGLMDGIYLLFIESPNAVITKKVIRK